MAVRIATFSFEDDIEEINSPSHHGYPLSCIRVNLESEVNEFCETIEGDGGKVLSIAFHVSNRRLATDEDQLGALAVVTYEIDTPYPLER